MPLAAAAVIAAGTYMAARSQKKPQQAPGVDIGQTLGDTISSNIANAPEAEYLARRTNEFNQNQNLALLEKAIPGYGAWAKKQAATADSYASGKISDETANNLTRLAAERGISTGARGQANDYSLLRDFGVQQQQQQQYSSNIMQTLAGLAKVSPMSPLAMYATPSQGLQAATYNQGQDQSYLNAMNSYNNTQAAAPWNALAAGAGAYMSYGGWGAANSQKLTYDQFLNQNPNSSAAQYYNNRPYTPVQTNWSFSN